MTNKKSITVNFLKKATFFDVLFYVLFLISIVTSITLEKKHLMYMVPLVLFSIILKYISITKKNAKPLFILALIAAIISNVLSLNNFTDYFMWITISTSVYLVCCTLILKTYLYKTKLKSLLSFSAIIGFLLVSYVIYAVLELLIDYIPGNMLLFTFLCAFFLMIYVLTFAIVYINDNYSNAAVLLASGFFAIFQIALSPINELFIYSKTFTVLIIISNILSFYLFMRFIAVTKVIEAKDIKEKYI